MRSDVWIHTNNVSSVFNVSSDPPELGLRKPLIRCPDDFGITEIPEIARTRSELILLLFTKVCECIAS